MCSSLDVDFEELADDVSSIAGPQEQLVKIQKQRDTALRLKKTKRITWFVID
jgi:hypothetical protein